jgi:DNA-directed RNA polymerase specialized sigma24 family protein
MSDMYSKQEVGNGRAGFAWVEQLKPLLQEMLAGVRRHRETALLAGFDSGGIVTAALHSVSIVAPQTALSQLRDMDAVRASFRLVLEQTLEDQPEHAGERHGARCTTKGNTPSANASKPHDENVVPWLASWLEIFCSVMSEVHPKAIEVVMLRLEGCDNRQVARRLGLPLRLVKRIVHDIQQACERAEKEGMHATGDCEGI